MPARVCVFLPMLQSEDIGAGLVLVSCVGFRSKRGLTEIEGQMCVEKVKKINRENEREECLFDCRDDGQSYLCSALCVCFLLYLLHTKHQNPPSTSKLRKFWLVPSTSTTRGFRIGFRSGLVGS